MFTVDTTPIRTPEPRVTWVDYAKGVCIIMVVMMHVTFDYSTLTGSEGWLHQLVHFARPFRLPGFFLLSGLFLSLTINRPLRQYLDQKFLHFIYFYVIWLIIHLGVTEPELLVRYPGEFIKLFLFAWIEPVNTLWFVHMLAIFFLVTRLLRDVSKPLVFLVAAALQIAFRFGLIDTGWSVPDRFFDRYVYFYVGYAAAPWVFSFARQIPARPQAAVICLLLWAIINAGFTLSNIDGAPGISLLLGFMGAAAIVVAASLLAGLRATAWLRYCGAHSIVVYLSFFLPMKVGLKLLAGTGLIPDVGTATLLITLFAVATPLIFYWLINDTWLVFLYKRPTSFKLRKYHRVGVRL